MIFFLKIALTFAYFLNITLWN